MNAKYIDRIEVNPEVMVGKPVIRGSRITVELILRQLAQGIKTEEILQNYPHLSEEDIYACLEYATDLVEEDKTYSS